MNDELPDVAPKKKGRPVIGHEPMSAAKRKREQRTRQATAIQEKESTEWTDAECRAVLNGIRWRGGVLDKAAWKQLGKLRGFM